MGHTTASVSKLLEEKFGKGSGLGADYASVLEEMRPQIEAAAAIKDAEREVVEAAVAYRVAQRDGFRRSDFGPGPLDLYEAQRKAVDALIDARASLPPTPKE